MVNFGGDDHLVVILAISHPFANLRLALLVLVIIRSVNEVTAVLIEEVEHAESGFLVTFAQDSLPGVSEIHCAEA